MEYVEVTLTKEQQAILEEIALVLDFTLPAQPSGDERLRADDDVLLYSKGFKHQSTHECLWGHDKLGLPWCALLTGTFIVFSKYKPDGPGVLERYGSMTRMEFDERF